MSSSSDDSDLSNGSPTPEDVKMKNLLAEWDDGKEEDNGAFVDSDGDDDDEDDEESKARKVALLKANLQDDSEEDEEAEEEAGEEVGEEAEEEEGSDEEEEEDEESGEDSGEDEEVSEEGEEEVSDEEYEEEVIEEEVVEDDSVKDQVAPRSVKDSRSVRSVDTDDCSADGTIDDCGEPIVDTLKKKPKKKKPKKKVKKITEIDEEDTEEDKAMKALLAGWEEDAGDAAPAVTEEESDDEDDDSEASEREVILDDCVLDHIVLAAPDLEEAMKDFQKRSGIEPIIAGTIKGLGIKCARVSFNDSTYLEIIAPDPAGPGPIGQLIKARGIKELTPFHYAVRLSRTEALKDEVGKFGYTPDHITMFGAKPDGTPRKWEMLFLYGHKLGGTCPFFINWSNSDHPCAKLPVVGKLKKFTVRAPEEDPVHELLDHVGATKIIIETGKPKISFQFSSPEGTVKFSTSKAVGFKFPGFDDDGEGGGVEEDEMVVFEDLAAPELLPVGDADYDDISDSGL
jgi:hypothetical protein